jgi:hypothetical protein
MTTCPRCGRVAGDEIVCAQCGMSLALVRRNAAARSTGPIDALALAEDGGADTRDVKLWRVGALVGLTCLLAAAAAIVLLNQHGSGKADLGLPRTTAPSRAAPPLDPSVDPSGGPTRVPAETPTAVKITGPAPPTRSKASQAAARSTSTASRRATSAPPSRAARTSSAAPGRSVHLVKGALDRPCGPHCYYLVVTLVAFPGGTHSVACWAGRGGLFARYTMTAATSATCFYKRPRDSVWVVVDGTDRSNTLGW